MIERNDLNEYAKNDAGGSKVTKGITEDAKRTFK